MKRCTTVPAAPREDLFWMHAVRILAAFGVIWLHVAADVITEWKRLPQDWWWSAHLYNSLARGCVGLFVMVSGALLLPVHESIRTFLRKRCNRVAVPFISWSILYLIWRKLLYQPSMDWPEIFSRLASGNIHFHLWFIYSLVGIYLMTPIFRVWVQQAQPKELLYFLIIWFIIASCLPTLEILIKLITHRAIHFKPIAEPAQGLIGFFVMGYALNRFASRDHLKWAWLGVFSGFAICFYGTYFFTQKTGVFQSLFYESLAPNVVLYSISLFVIFKIAGQKFEHKLKLGVQRRLLQISKSTLGIYLIHPMAMDILLKGRWGFVLKGNMQHPLYMIPLTAIATYLLSLAVVQIIQRIPYLKRIV